MSQNPSTPPEYSSTEDTPPDSLLARLRKITGVTAEVPLRDEAEVRIHDGAPPVDRLIRVVRDCFAALTACGVAVAAVIAAGAIWLWERTLEGRMRARRAQARSKTGTAIRPDRSSNQASLQGAVVTSGAPGAAADPTIPRQPAAILEAPQPAILTTEEELEVTAAPLAMEEVKEYASAAPALTKNSRRLLRRLVIAAAAVVLTLPALLLIKPVRYYFTSLMGWGNAAVIVANNGWLFPRVEGQPAAAAVLPLRESAALLRAHGAALVVISVPAKSAVYPERLSGSGGDQLQRHPHIAVALKELTDAGAQVLDLGPVLHGLKSTDSAEGFVFSPQGAHWSPRGMAQGAFAAASFIQQQPGYAALPLQPSLAVMAPATGLATTDDLVTALDSPRLQSRYAAQTVPLIRLLSAAKMEPLASDPASPVVLLGGESIRLYDDPALGHPAGGLPDGQGSSAGFAQHLAWYLSTSLEVHAAGSGINAAKDWISSRPEAERKAKRLIVWVLSDAELLR